MYICEKSSCNYCRNLGWKGWGESEWHTGVCAFNPFNRSLVPDLNLAVLLLHYTNCRPALKKHAFCFVLLFHPYLPFMSPHQVDFQGSYLYIIAFLSCIGFEVRAREEAADVILSHMPSALLALHAGDLFYSQKFPQVICWMPGTSAVSSFNSAAIQGLRADSLHFLAGAHS